MPCLPFAVPVNSITDYLPAHLLLGIFDHLPLCEVFSLDKICQRFRSLKPSALERRREVVLVVGREWRGFSAEFAYQNRLLQQDGTEWFGPPVDTAHSRLRFETLNGETVKQLCGSLPAVATLQVMLTDVGSSESVDGLIYLLAKWAFTLTTLKVGARFRETRRHSTARTGDAEELIARNLCSLLTVVNQLPELQHLALQLHHRLLPPVNLSGQSGQSASLQPKPVDLSALSRLQSAFLLSHDRAAVFYDALKRHAERNAALVSLGLQSCVDAEQFYRAKLARLSALFAAKFLALDLGRAKLTQRDMDALGAHFSALTHLGLTLSTPVALLPVLLRSCKALTHLQLYIHTASYMQANSATNRGTSRSQIASIASRTSNMSPGAQLPQIIALTVTFASECSHASHLDVASLRLEHTFPGLQSLEYSASATCCTICGLRVNASAEQRKRCHDISLAYLQRAMPKCKVCYYLDI